MNWNRADHPECSRWEWWYTCLCQSGPVRGGSRERVELRAALCRCTSTPEPSERWPVLLTGDQCRTSTWQTRVKALPEVDSVKGCYVTIDCHPEQQCFTWCTKPEEPPFVCWSVNSEIISLTYQRESAGFCHHTRFQKRSRGSFCATTSSRQSGCRCFDGKSTGHEWWCCAAWLLWTSGQESLALTVLFGRVAFK